MRWYIIYNKLNNKYIINIDDKYKLKGLKNINFFFEGYFIPRKKSYYNYKSLKNEELLCFLYNKYGVKFIDYIKGIFLIIIVEKEEIKIFTDRHGIKKAFIYENEDSIYISNDISIILVRSGCNLDPEKITLFSILSHNLPGITFFKNVYTTFPAGKLTISKQGFQNENYWHPSALLTNRNINYDKLNYHVNYWEDLINQYIEYLNPDNIILTLTGGNDSRLVLSALLSLNYEVKTFTYGNLKSIDAVVAKEIARSNNILHNHYNIIPSKKWLDETSKKIISFGNSLINIHRAHRYSAAVLQKNKYRGVNMIFTGLVGGEYLKKMDYDDIVLPKIFKKLQNRNNIKDKNKILKNYIESAGIHSNYLDIKKIFKLLNDFLKQGGNFKGKEKRFIYTYLFYGAAHHVQDSLIYMQNYEYVVTPFMDIDFLEMISNSPYWYINKKGLYNKLFHSYYMAYLTQSLSPKLGEVAYAKKGKYSPNDIVYSPLKYLFKRLKYFINNDFTYYPPNFPMGPWLYDFVRENISEVPHEISSLYNMKYLNKQLNLLKNKPNEETWHLLTNPINVFMNYEHFKIKT